MKNIFITGITGLLGTNLAEDLLKEGHYVKALVRRDFNEFSHPNLQLIQGNLCDEYLKELSETDVFIHIAAETRQNLTKYIEYYKTNVEATQHVFKTCEKAGVKKFIFVSSANTIGYGSISNLGDETQPIKTPFITSMYAKSKWEAERDLLSNNSAVEVVIINPTFMIGKYDSKPSSGKIILMAWKKKIIFYPPGGKNFVAVKDVSQAVIQSIELGKNGERYIVGGENLSYKDFFIRLNEITNQKPIMIKIPKFLMLLMGGGGDIFRFFNIKLSICTVNMQILCIHNYFSNEKSTKEFKIRYNFINNSIKEAVQYFEERNIR